MNFVPSPRLIALAAACLVPISAPSQTNITWGAQGLPPGLSLVSSNLPVGTVRVQGTPTTNGVFSAVIYPIVNGVFGDMNEVTFRILPAGVNLPTFYTYARRLALKNGNFTPIAGGGRWIMGSTAAGDRVAYTANGQSFTGVRTPPKGFLKTAASVGTNHVLAIYGTQFGASNTAYYSLNGAAFTPDGPLPPEAEGGWRPPLLASDGQSRYFLVSLDAGSMFPPSPPVARIWSRTIPSGTNSWSTLAELPLPTNNNSAIMGFNNPSISWAAGSNVALMALAEGGNYIPQALALFRSTNGGGSWTNVVTTPSLISVAYDSVNKRFVGSSPDGVYTSPDGAGAWTRRTTEDVGEILYSSFHKLLFSAKAGVSSDGASWMPYDFGAGWDFGAGPGFKLTANTNGSVVFLGPHQLSTVYIPSFGTRPQIGRVNTAFTYELKVD